MQEEIMNAYRKDKSTDEEYLGPGVRLSCWTVTSMDSGQNFWESIS
jgi:hypothetical protein